MNASRVKLLALLLLVQFTARSQESLFELVILPDKDFMRNVIVESPHSSFVREVKKGEIKPGDLEVKRIGLLTFSLYEQNHSKQKSQLTFTYSKDGQLLVQRIYAGSIEAVKQSAEKRGLNLLMPEEYLTTETQKQQYAKAASDIKSVIGKKIDLYATLESTSLRNTPEGIDFVAAFYEAGKNAEVNTILAQLCESLGLDALLSVQIATTCTNISIAMNNAQMILHGRHPIKGSKDGTGLKYGGYYYIPATPMAFVGIEKGNVTGEDLRAFSPLMGRMTHDFMEMLQMEHELLFKP